jgi:transcriptional regulator with XRE-family HTH domain
MPTDKPTALGKEIGQQLRLRRQRAGLNGAELAHRLRWTTTRVSRFETGVRRPGDIEIGMYLASCGASQDEVDAVIALAGEDAHGYRVIDHSDTVKDETSVLLFDEQSALAIEGYEPTCVPALLMTEAYARALLIEAGVRHSAAMEHRLEGLNQRQAILQQPQQPSYTFYVHENALTTPVGDNLIMNEQLLHLTFLSSWRRCTIRVVPQSAGGAGLVKNGFERMTFTDMDPVVTVDLARIFRAGDGPA